MSQPRDPVTFAVETSKDNWQRFDMVPGAGDEIDFAVGGPRCHGAIWKIKARRKKSDVYLFSRAIGGTMKMSMHQTKIGPQWWYQWTKEHMDAQPQFPIVDKRQIDHWSPVEQEGGSGWATGVVLFTRHQDVVRPPDAEELPPDMLWIPPPPKGHATAIRVVTAQAKGPKDFVQINGGKPVPMFALQNREVVLLIVSHIAVPDEVNREVDGDIARLIQAIPGGLSSAAAALSSHEPGVFRAFACHTVTDGERAIWDVAVNEPRQTVASRVGALRHKLAGLIRR